MTFSTTTTTLIFTIGAAVLATWALVRFPDRGPHGLGRTFVHFVLAYTTAALVPAGIELVGRIPGTNRLLIATLFVVLPALLYMFLATLWLFRALQERAGLRRS
jgi:hypothetical protein